MSDTYAPPIVPSQEDLPAPELASRSIITAAPPALPAWIKEQEGPSMPPPIPDESVQVAATPPSSEGESAKPPAAAPAPHGRAHAALDRVREVCNSDNLALKAVKAFLPPAALFCAAANGAESLIKASNSTTHDDLIKHLLSSGKEAFNGITSMVTGPARVLSGAASMAAGVASDKVGETDASKKDGKVNYDGSVIKAVSALAGKGSFIAEAVGIAGDSYRKESKSVNEDIRSALSITTLTAISKASGSDNVGHLVTVGATLAASVYAPNYEFVKPKPQNTTHEPDAVDIALKTTPQQTPPELDLPAAQAANDDEGVLDAIMSMRGGSGLPKLAKEKEHVNQLSPMYSAPSPWSKPPATAPGMR